MLWKTSKYCNLHQLFTKEACDWAQQERPSPVCEPFPPEKIERIYVNRFFRMSVDFVSFCLFGSALFSCSVCESVNRHPHWQKKYEILVSGARDSVIHLPSLVHNIQFLLTFPFLNSSLKDHRVWLNTWDLLARITTFPNYFKGLQNVFLGQLPFPTSVFISKDQCVCALFIFLNWQHVR